MSPSAALHDPVFRAYVGLVFGGLMNAGILLALLQFAFRIELGSVSRTYRSWLVMAPLRNGPLICRVDPITSESAGRFANVRLVCNVRCRG